MTYNNPNLFPELRIEGSNPADAWQPREAHQSMRENTASDPSGYMRAVTRDGEVVGTETGKSMRASSATANEALNAASGVPYDYAVDPVTRCQISPSQLTEQSILFFHGRGEVTVAQARALGWYFPGVSQPTNGTPKAPFDEGQGQPKVETNPDLHFDLLADEAVDRDYSNLVDTTAGIEQVRAISEIVENGEIGSRTLGTLATQLQCKPEQLQSRIAPIMRAMEEQARAVMSEGIEGLDSNDVVSWSQQNCPEKLKAAMNKQATMRQTAGYAELRQSYLESLGEHSPEVALKADLGPGITQFLHPTKGVMVRIPGYGNGMTWKAAMKAFGPKS